MSTARRAPDRRPEHDGRSAYPPCDVAGVDSGARLVDDTGDRRTDPDPDPDPHRNDVLE
ncbi:hypothetical protein [Streptomyces tauricus]|uniref:hypothetical protein n=1 Tax=Streptomyces tauricus TaxID=68274 RepID=UPI002244B9A4|nr:hypothetical protein [Streptomyces tauricus]MCW8100448.1 hypothetical protein [Streptomyces tauricus]